MTAQRDDISAAADKECGDTSGQQSQSRGFRHGGGLKGEKGQGADSGGKGAPHSARRVLVDNAVVRIRYKQIARIVEDQSFRIRRPGGKEGGECALHSARREFIDLASRCVCYKEIARAIKSQRIRIQSRGKGASHSARRVFSDVADSASLPTNRSSRTVKSQ